MDRYYINEVINVEEMKHPDNKNLKIEAIVELAPMRALFRKTFELSTKDWEDAQEKGYIEGHFTDALFMDKPLFME